MLLHCAKCVIRLNLWKPASWPSLSGLPPLAETTVPAGTRRQSVEEMLAIGYSKAP